MEIIKYFLLGILGIILFVAFILLIAYNIVYILLFMIGIMIVVSIIGIGILVCRIIVEINLYKKERK